MSIFFFSFFYPHSFKQNLELWKKIPNTILTTEPVGNSYMWMINERSIRSRQMDNYWNDKIWQASLASLFIIVSYQPDNDGTHCCWLIRNGCQSCVTGSFLTPHPKLTWSDYCSWQRPIGWYGKLQFQVPDPRAD